MRDRPFYSVRLWLIELQINHTKAFVPSTCSKTSKGRTRIVFYYIFCIQNKSKTKLRWLQQDTTTYHTSLSQLNDGIASRTVWSRTSLSSDSPRIYIIDFPRIICIESLEEQLKKLKELVRIIERYVRNTRGLRFNVWQMLFIT